MANFSSNDIIKITPAGETSVFSTIKDGDGNHNAHIIFKDGKLYVTKLTTNRVYELGSEGKFKVLVGDGSKGVVDGIGTEAKLSRPNGIASGLGNTIYTNGIIGTWIGEQPGTHDSEVVIRKITLNP